MPFITAHIKDRKSKGAMESDIKVLDVATVRVCGESVCVRTTELRVCVREREKASCSGLCVCVCSLVLTRAHTHART
jgi:hypothetical protein